jgi:3-oxoacyl-[acyl-carrier protein] reductase
MDIQGHVALVTGASHGIGQAIALRLAEAGVDVAVGYGHNQAAGEQQAERIRQLGRRSIAVGGDVRDPRQVIALVEQTEAALGPVDILVSNAGISQRQSLEEITVEDWDRMMQVNVRPAFLLVQRVASGMRERKWGRIILVSSVAAFTGGVVGPHYAASKAALLGLMHFLAGALAPHGVTVNAIAPAMIAGGGTLPGDAAQFQQYAAHIPVGRLGKLEEVAEATLSLIANPFITAQTLLIDGGLYPH